MHKIHSGSTLRHVCRSAILRCCNADSQLSIADLPSTAASPVLSDNWGMCMGELQGYLGDHVLQSLQESMQMPDMMVSVVFGGDCVLTLQYSCHSALLWCCGAGAGDGEPGEC